MKLNHKNDRIDIRVKGQQKTVLAQAAGLSHMSLTAFILNSAIKEAEEIIAEKVYFALSEKQWKEFCSALDRAPREIPQLKKLFARPSIFDDRKAST